MKSIPLFFCLFCLAIFEPAKAQSVVTGDKPALPSHDLLRSLYAAGQAAGNAGDCYQNMDAGHSLFKPADFCPQVRAITEAEARVLPPRTPVIRNASVAVPNVGAGGGELSIPQARLAFALPTQVDAALIFADYQNNRHTWHPAVRTIRDESADAKKFLSASWDRTGVLSPAIASCRGRSGSDQKFIRLSFMCLASFRPDVKARLIADGQLMAALEFVLRRALVDTDAEYLTAKAHPSAYGIESNVWDDAYALKVIRLANSITADALPPVVALRVAEDGFTEAAPKDFPENWPEFGHDTPVSISRFYRGPAMEKRIVVTAADSRDPNGRPLNFSWSVVRGNESVVKIRPLNPEQSTVEITFVWHDGGLLVPGTMRTSTLNAVLCVARSGSSLSAPAFVNCYHFAPERRVYENGRLVTTWNDKADAETRNWSPESYAAEKRTWDRVETVRDGAGQVTRWEFFTGRTNVVRLPGQKTGYWRAW